MALWELDEFAPPQLLGFVRSLSVPSTFAGSRWLPDSTISDLEFQYVLGSFRRPVMATVMGWDAEAPLHARQGAGARVSGELPPIKRKSRIGEKQIIRFLQPRAGTPDQLDAVRSVYVDVAELFDTVQARVEWLRLQALSEDKVVYNEDGVIFSFDFGIDDTFQIDLTTQTNGAGTDVNALYSTVWTDLANSNPVLDLLKICDVVQAKTGQRPVEAVFSQQVINLFAGNVAMRNMIRGTNAPAAILTPGEIQTLFTLYGLPTITPYDVIVSQEQPDGSLVDVRPLNPAKGFLLPAGWASGIGGSTATNSTLWGPTAESRKLLGTPLASQAPGIYAATYNTDEPPAEYTKVAAVAFPSMPGANVLAQMKVTA
jgi:hypothetical protein